MRQKWLVPIAAALLFASACTNLVPMNTTAEQDGQLTQTSRAPSTSPVPSVAVAPTRSPATPTPIEPTTTTTRAGVIATSTPATEGAESRRNPAVLVYKAAGASVVNIASVALVRTRNGLSEQPQGTGSGFFIDDRGHIVTNDHVIEEADELMVTFQNRDTAPAELVGRDPDNDLAVIKVDPGAETTGGILIGDIIKPARLGDSDKVTIGEDAIAIGSPLGLEQTVTSGIVSALRWPGEEAGGAQIGLLGGAIQTDAAINPGNSGGPLFNADGEVIGVNSAGLSPTGGSIGLGFAIPINVVKRVAPELISKGCYEHPLVGVSGIALSQIGRTAKSDVGVSTELSGILVQEVSAGAAKADIRAGSRTVRIGVDQIKVGGDVIVTVDGRPIVTSSDLRGYVENNRRPGDTVTVTIVRDDRKLDVEVVLTGRTTASTCR